MIRDKAEHLFGKRLEPHRLGGLLDKFKGDKIQATRALYTASQTMYDKGLYLTARGGVLVGRVIVEGETVTPMGKVIDGMFHIGTAGVVP